MDTKKRKSFIRHNSSISHAEYFADGVTFYFNQAKSRKIKIFDMDKICNRKVLLEEDKVLYDLVEDIFLQW